MPGCNDAPRTGQRYCPECHSKYMRAWRAKRRREQDKLREQVIHLRRRVLELEREKQLHG